MNRSVIGLLHVCFTLALFGCDLGKESVSATAGDEGAVESATSGNESSASEGGDPSATSVNDPVTATESGDPSATEGGESSGGPDVPQCLEVDVGVADFATPTSFGFTIDELMANIAGERMTMFAWGPQEGPVQLVSVPEPTPLTLTVTYAGGGVRDIDAELNPDWTGEVDGPEVCEDRVEIDMQVHLLTADGQFDELVEDVTLVATSADRAEFRIRFEPDGFNGTFSGVDDVMIIGEGEITYFEINAEVREDDTNGAVMVEVILEEPISGALYGSLGGWPSE